MARLENLIFLKTYWKNFKRLSPLTYMMDKTKRLTIRKLTGGSPCCVCDGIPAYEIAYPVPDGDATEN